MSMLENSLNVTRYSSIIDVGVDVDVGEMRLQRGTKLLACLGGIGRNDMLNVRKNSYHHGIHFIMPRKAKTSYVRVFSSTLSLTTPLPSFLPHRHSTSYSGSPAHPCFSIPDQLPHCTESPCWTPWNISSVIIIQSYHARRTLGISNPHAGFLACSETDFYRTPLAQS